MRGLLACCTLALIIGAIVGLSRESAAGEETATATPSPTPVYASPYSAKIDVFFVDETGTPTIGLAPIDNSFVNGQRCNTVGLLIVIPAVSWQVDWPWFSHVSPCSEIGATVSLCSSVCAEEFTFTGEDTSTRVLWPSSAHLLEANFSAGGLPTQVEITGVHLYRGEELCLHPAVSVPVLAEALRFSRGLLREACREPSTVLTATFSTVAHGELSASFTMEDDGLTQFAVVAPRLTTDTPSPTPSPSETASPTPTATPGQLPASGGRPWEHRSASTPLGLAVFALTGLAFATVLWIGSGRVRRL